MNLLHLNVVLAAIESEDTSSAVLQSARELAMAAGARLYVINVVAGNATPRVVSGENVPDGNVKRMLERSEIPVGETTVHIVSGDAAREIRALADRIGADVIVLGRHRGRASSAEPFGSTAMRVVSNAAAPCLVLSSNMSLPLERILVPVDLSETSHGALMLALSWASALRGAEKSSGSATSDGARLTALFVDGTRAGDGTRPEPGSLEDELRKVREEAGNWASVAIDGIVVRADDVVSTVTKYATENHSELIVLGTRGLGADTVRRLGSVSAGIARQVNAPILLVPPAVWSTSDN